MSPFAHPRPGRLALASALVALALGAAGCDAPSAMGEADSLILIISNDLWAPSEETAYATASHVYETIIPRNVRLAEAPSHGKPVILYDASSRGSYTYLNLARELLDDLEVAA